MALNYPKWKKRLEELKYTEPNVTVVEDEKGNKVTSSSTNSTVPYYQKQENIRKLATGKSNSNTFKPITTTTNTTAKKKEGLFDAFDDGYDFGDVTKTILTGGKMVLEPIYKVGKGLVTDPVQTVKSVGIGMAEGYKKADDWLNNAIDDGLDSIIPGRAKNTSKREAFEKEIEALGGFDSFSKETDKEIKKKVLKIVEEYYGKDSPNYTMYESQFNSKPKKVNILNAKYTDTETYKKAQAGELSEEQQEIYNVGENIGGMAYDMTWGWLTGGIVKTGGGSVKAVKKATEIAGKTSLFTRSQQSAYEEAVAQGYDEDKARLYGLTVGGFEVVMESFGFDEYGALGKLQSGNIVKIAGGEAMEEFFMPYIEALSKTGYFGEDFDFEEATEEALRGAGSGAMLGIIMSSGGRGYKGVDAVIEKVNNGEEITDRDVINAMQEIEADKPGTIQKAFETSTQILKEDIQLDKNRLNISYTDKKVNNKKELAQPQDEKQLRSQYYQYTPTENDSELTKYTKDSATKVMNNTKRSHEFSDFVSALSNKTGQRYRFTNDAELNKLGYRVEKSELSQAEQKQLSELQQQLEQANSREEYDSIQNKIDKLTYWYTNGLVTEDGEVLINVDSHKALNSIVGHETLHLLENTPEIENIKKFAIEYAKVKGDYEARYESASKMYKKNADIEVVADIVGDYLFTDQQFINNLSMEQPNVFKRIYNEIKHWLKMATAGSKEARQLEQLKHNFEKAMNSKQASAYEGSEDKFSLIGDNANKTYIQEMNKTKAEMMKKQNKSDQEIWDATGYQYNESIGKWQTEVADPKFKSKGTLEAGEEYRLEDVVDAEELFKAYPQLRDVMVKRTDFSDIADTQKELEFMQRTTKGATTTDDKILINENIKSKKRAGEILTHEVQHKIQELEGDDGSHAGYLKQDENGEYHLSKEYTEDLTEKEARQVQNRNMMSEEERANIVPKHTSDKIDFTRYSLTDNQGRELTKEQQEFFKDSKVRDENGNLLTVYHGSISEDRINVFDTNIAPVRARTGPNGTYFTSNQRTASNYRGRKGTMYAVYLDIKNPLNITEDIKKYRKEGMTFGEAKRKALEKLNDTHDGVIFEGDDFNTDEYIVFNSNQIKNVTNTNPTSNEDIRYSLSVDDYGMQHRPSTDYGDASNFEENMPDVFEHPEWYMFGGDDWYKKAYKESWNALKKVRNNPEGEITIYRATIGDTFNEGDWVSPSKAYAEWHNYSNLEGKGNIIELKVKAKDIRFAGDDLNEFGYFPNGVDEYSLSRFEEQRKTYGNYNVHSEDVRVQRQLEEAIAPLQQQIEELSDVITNLKEDIAPATQDTVNEARKEGLKTLTDEDAPLDEGVFNFNEEKVPEIKSKKDIIEDIRNNFNIKQKEAREVYNNIVKNEYATVDDVYNELEAYRTTKYEQENEYYKDIKNYIKGTKLDISYIKDQIADYGNKYRMSNMGKGLILGNSGQSIDEFYTELSQLYPDVFPSYVMAEADQLDRISEFMFKDTIMTYAETISDEDLYELAQNIHADIGNNERYRGSNAQRHFWHQDVQNMIAPVETQEEFLKTKPDVLDDGYTPYLDMAKKLNAENTSGYSDVRRELDRMSTNTQETNNQAEKGNKPTAKVVKKKSEARSMLNYLFINRNEAIDNYARETGNKNIKVLADHVNNVFGEVSTNINNTQTDNYGKSIGKSITDIFNQARKEGLSEAFNDYLFHRSNVARHRQSKGSQIPLLESDLLVKEYNEDYPQFKKWAKEVNQYNKNNLYKQVEAGLYTREFADKLSKMYDFYVPFFEDVEKVYAENWSNEIGVRGTVKRAKGGADKNLLDFEQAMMKQTQSTITAIRKNQLYKEIVNSSDERLDIGNGDGDVKPLFQDEKGYYVTAFTDGKQQSAKVSKELFEGLENRLEQQIKDVEQRLGGVTKTLQTLGKLRRNMLTTWNPTFWVQNPLKDIQDAPLNSQYAKDWAKNYPKALKELTTGKGEHVQEFLNMYGQANLMGDYTTDSGVFDVTKTAKINKNFNKILQMNEVMEMIPRYAEYLASLDNGTSQMEALYNAREVTTNFGRGGVITKALNRNGFTFLNASVQGFDKLYRNFSGENGARGVAGAMSKALLLGVVPALFNEMAFGSGDDEDEEYEALPDYIKDNYYLIKTGDGEFVRIPKGRMLSIFGSAGRRTLEYLQGEEDAFKGYVQNAYSQVGIQNPLESNIFAPIFQAYGSKNGKTWYGTDLVPTRLQDKPAEEQYDETTDAFSIWLGDKLNISPYKLNYVLDQYSGGFGDMLFPMITEEGTSDAETVPEMLFAPIKDKFVVNSTDDNKYVSDFYTKNDELEVKSNSMYATDEDKLKSQYAKTISYEMGELYAERRAIQNDDSLTKAEKYRKSQAIKKEINRLAKEGLDNYQNIQKTDNYAIVGDREFNKYTTSYGEEKWGSVDEETLEEMNSLGMELDEKSEYFTARNNISEIRSKYDDSTDYNAKKREIISVVKNTNLTDDQKAYLYDKYYGSTDTLNAVTTLGIDFDSYLDFESQEFEADKDMYGKTISGSKKKKVFDYINSMDIEFEQKLILAKLQYNSYDEYNHEIIDYLNRSNLSYEEIVELLKKMGFEVDNDGNVYW